MKKYLLIILTFLTIQMTFGQKAMWFVYDTSNTIMPSNFITDITIDGNNNKWIGSNLGLSKFDNIIWTNFDTSNSGLINPHITSLASEGIKIWIGNSNNLNTLGSGLVTFDGGIWNVFDTANTPEIISNIITSVSIDNQNNKWIGGVTGQVLKFDNTSWTAFNNIHDPYWGYSINDFAFDADTIWLATFAGIWKFFDASNWVNIHTLNSGLPSMQVLTIKMENSIKWIGTWNGLAKLEDSTWTIYNSSNSILPHNGILSLAIENNGTKWIGTYGGGLVKLVGNTMTIFDTNNSDIPNNFIRTIKIDGNNNKWIGTDNGLAVFNENGVMLYNNEIIKNSLLISILPNPFNNYTTIEFENNNSENYTLEIYNNLGQKVRTIENIQTNKIKIERGNFNSGIYFFQLKNNRSKRQTGKLVVE